MAKYKVAHIREQGIDLIVAPLDSSFNSRTSQDQQDFIAMLQACATSAGLAGVVVPIWMSGSSVKFIAPPNWHPFFKSPGIYQRVIASINKELTCG